MKDYEGSVPENLRGEWQRSVRRLNTSAILAGCIFLLSSPVFAATPLPPDPIYIRVDNGWKGFYAKNDQFVEYLLSGSELPQDPYHILLAPRVGLFVDYASKNEFAGGETNLLESHSKWVVDYWRKHADSVERKNRDDLSEKEKI